MVEDLTTVETVDGLARAQRAPFERLGKVPCCRQRINGTPRMMSGY